MTLLETSADNLRQMSALADDAGVAVVDARDLERVLDALARYRELPLEPERLGDPSEAHAGQQRALATLNRVLRTIEPEASMSENYESEWMRGLIWGYRTVRDIIEEGARV